MVGLNPQCAFAEGKVRDWQLAALGQGGPGKGSVCLEMRACRAGNSISRRGKGAPAARWAAAARAAA